MSAPRSARGTTGARLANAARWLRGGLEVAHDIYNGTVDLVETVHGTISDTGGRWNPVAPIERPIRRLVYRQVRDIGALSFTLARVGVGMTARLAPGAPDAQPDNLSLTLQSAINGVCGDYLADSGNELALTMTLFDAAGVALETADRHALSAQLAGARPRLLLLVHGLGMNERQWRSEDGHDIGDRLAADLDATALRLRYNSGRAIADNGRELARRLEALASAWPGTLDDIVLIGHSMGGLVARRALEHAAARGMAWPLRLGEVVCLGAPHRGAPLERLGQAANQILGWSRYSRPFTAIGDRRSVGVKDLRHGVEWQDTPNPEAAETAYLLIAASLGTTDGDLRSRVIGDLLVPVDSALDDRVAGADDGTITVRVFHRLNHFDLLSDDAVYITIRDWWRARRGDAVPSTHEGST